MAREDFVPDDDLAGCLAGGPHEIHVVDGGSDHLLPGRWLARTNWLGPDCTAYGPTSEGTVSNLRAVIRDRHPRACWFQAVPVVEHGHV
jgi:hypothetical protein